MYTVAFPYEKLLLMKCFTESFSCRVARGLNNNRVYAKKFTYKNQNIFSTVH